MTFESNEKLEFWADSWEESVDDLERQAGNFRLLSPHLLILDLTDEIENNQLSNKTARLYFQQQISSYCSTDSIIFNLMREELTLVRRGFGNDHVGQMLQACRKALRRFENGEYFQSLANKLFETVIAPEWEKDDDLLIIGLNEQLILEFLFKGYSLKTIRRMPRNVLSKYDEFDDDGTIYPNTNFPHGVDYQEIERNIAGDTTSSQHLYNKSVKGVIDNLTVSDRLQAFRAYFEASPQQQIYVYQIKGLRGDSEIRLGDVTFYSPKVKRYMVAGSDSLGIDETFGAGDDTKFLNAAVETHFIDGERGKIVSIDKVDEALDTLSCYLTSEAQPTINMDSVISVSLDGKPRSSSHSVSKTADHMMYARGLVLEDELLSSYMTIAVRRTIDSMLAKTFDERSEVERALLRSLHWYRKGETASKLEDQLLNYWIAIEKLMPKERTDIYSLLKKGESSKFALARESIASLQASNLYQYGWNLFFEVREYTKTSIISAGWGQKLEIQEELKKKSGLSAEGRLNLKPFIENLEDIKAQSKLRTLNRKIDLVRLFYSDIASMRKQVEKTLQQIKDDMTLFYWHRNKIVHDAHFDNTLLPFYIPRAKGYASYLLQAVIDGHARRIGGSIEEILLSHMVDFDIIQEKLKEQVFIDVFAD